jgi:membrane-associated protease RseP (regulator of RpoE activity)
VGALGQVSFFVALILVIVVHEAAHFGVARLFGIKVTEFYVGFGPKIWSTKRGETEVGFKWIPAGGYVKIAGMSPYEEIAPEDLPRTYGAKPRWQRALVIIAGPATHFVLAFLCFSIWLLAVGEPVEVSSPILDRVPQVLDGEPAPAYAAGLRQGDRVVALDGVPIGSSDAFSRYLETRVGEEIDVTVQRRAERLTVPVTPVTSIVEGEEKARIGVVLIPGRIVRETAGPVGSVTGGVREVGTALTSTVKGVTRIFGPEGVGRVVELVFTDAPRRREDPTSVVGVGRVAGNIASEGNFWDILYLFGVVNVFVGFLNLLPLPPFDGGHLAVLLIEKIRGRAIDMRKVIPVSAVVAAFFIVFTVAVVYVDLVKPPV